NRSSRAALVDKAGWCLWRGLGFAAARCLREHPQRSGGFSATLFLKFCNPIGYSINHIARRFTGRICLNLYDWAGFLALLYDSDCFLLRHCLISSFPYESDCIQRNSRHTVPKFLKLRTISCDYACKEEATFANAHRKRKKGHFTGKFFLFAGLFRAMYGREPYTGTEQWRLARQELAICEWGVFVFHVDLPYQFVRPVDQ